ncbi:folylpolyglutamate synthase [Colletotrichum spaethianum]|uniref:tetrahydrofolate synthase n=1 Tax=Colletotrichum spaethianum TaxID=700344 RepID=A0AA37P7B6_9PEZI|nr:folylpolyglutamate synthase [Colletotrichum spaethianum]GKT43054.1 folylpolyglutamate synthase [Colletotrichum spaethianum]
MSSSTPASRTYTDALNLLNTLIPNLKIHALFGKPQDAKPQNAAPKPPASDPNLLALPEMRAWLLRASLTPQRLSSLSYIHIAGTKGKGSVTTLTTSALLSSSQSGRVGTYTSPHLVTPRERIAVDGRPVSQVLFAASFFELWDLLSAAPADEALGIEAGSKPFYFRFLTLLALHIFLKEGVRSVVVECGIGGEYDATNAIPPAAVTTGVITQLGIDHVAMLGDTPEKIAWHKAGIMKPGVTTFTRRLDEQPGVMEVLHTRAREIGANLVEVADEEVTAWGGVPGAKLPGGDFQKRNQALAALAARHHLRVLEGRETGTEEHKLRDVPEPIIAGLREATLRGRHEVMERGNVSWYLDGAHNTDSLAEVARWISPVAADADSKFVLVFNQQERDASELLLGLLKEMKAAGVDLESRLSTVIFTRNDKTRIAEDVDLTVQEKCAAAFKEAYPTADALVCKDLTEMKSAMDATAAAQNTTTPKTRVLVTGSMYLVGNVIGLLEPEGLL